MAAVVLQAMKGTEDMEVEVIPASIKTLVVGKADIISYRDAVLSEAQKLVADLEHKWAEADAAQRAALIAGEMDQEWRFLDRREELPALLELVIAAILVGFICGEPFPIAWWR